LTFRFFRIKILARASPRAIYDTTDRNQGQQFISLLFVKRL